MPLRSLAPARISLSLCLALAALGVLAEPGAAQYTEDPGPTASFVFFPESPVSGEPVTFVSTSTPSQGQITALAWDFDGDGDFADAAGAEVTRTFGAGSHEVQLRATQTNGLQSIAFGTVQVRDPTPPPRRRIRPFPVVRIAGFVLPRSTLVTVLSVRAPRGADVRVRCTGGACPVRSLRRKTKTGSRPLRLRAFERRLAAGTKIALYVRKGDRIGKYTRFVIRAGRRPTRIDRCLLPGQKRPVRC